MIMGGEPSESGGKNKKIAVIYVVGEIVDGKGSAGLFQDESIGGDTLIKAIAQAEKDPKVSAIVLRIDSPGGSALASDLVWRSVVSCKKPVVTSMGNVAASGGYYIAMGSKKIFAEPGTITGSIGVVGGKIALEGLFNKLGVKTESISRGKNSGWLSSVEPFSPSEREAWLRTMQDMYRQFTTKAAEGRKLDLQHLRDDLAGGRVFTGRVAVGNKLVDKVGTLDDAVAEAKSMAGLKADEPVDRLLLPKPKTFLESMFGDSDMDTRLPLPAGELRELTAGLREVDLFRRVLSGPAVVLPYRLEIK
jgi:protease-4